MRLSLRSYGARVATHTHDFSQIVLPLAGHLDLRIGALAAALSPRVFVVIGRGAQHSFRACGPNSFVVLDTRDPALSAGTPIRALDGTLADLARYAGSELAAAEGTSDATFHLAALLAGRVRRSCAAMAPSADPIERALRVIAARYADKLTVADLADAAGLRPSQFHARFCRRTGKPPAAMLADTRLDHAEHLLRATATPIAEIAFAVGFSDQSALTRCFRRRRATTPDALRRRASS
jgi:AraC-like DNA-binding protein